jgi:predicted enzyme related to lactoylglutathione lyase
MSEAFQRHGAFSWCELMTTDVDAARRFYPELLGWTTEEFPMSGMMAGMTYTVVKADDTAITYRMT